MPNVDNRVVKMTFDNAEFERRVSQTIASLKRLEQATQFKGAKRGFADLDSAARKVNLKPLGDQARDVDGKFKFTGAQKGLADISLGAKKVNLNPLVDKATEVDRSFKFTGAQKGLADLGRTASQVNVGSIAEGAEEASSGISRMGTIALRTFGAISGAAVAVGGVMAAKIAGGPVMDGFHEMETNMESIQTILANTRSKGSTLDDVTAALDKLNKYSDQTIYNFSEMARNIGTFTAAGVDLDTSVKSIKGIANLAALSGSSSEQASTAMYQLSQAISTGTVRLMDWNSVSNAGMGGELFKTALFESGKALGQLNDVPLDQTFKEWEAANGSFRDSLQDEWLSADVLTTTLAGMSGDLTETQLRLRGFTEEGAKNLLALGQQGQEAAQSVKTLTQLFGVVREAIGTGWADSFKAIFGNFNEAKTLFTNMNTFIGGFISRSAEARNKMLLDWKESGGRLLMLLGFKNVVQTLLAVIDPIRKAFREFFPKRTSEDLIKMTQAFYRFTEAIKPSEKTVKNIGLVFRGFFGILKVGWIIISETAKFLFEIGAAIFGLIAGPNLAGLGKMGKTIGDFAKSLAAGGGAKIAGFFDVLRGGLAKVVGFLGRFRDALGDLFGKFDFKQPEAVANVTGRVQTRFEMLINALKTVGRFFQSLWQPFLEGMGVVGDTLATVGSTIVDFFSTLGEKVAGAMGEGDFKGALDIINTGLLGAITAMFVKFATGGLKINWDFGNGFFDGIKNGVTPVFEELTNVLKGMTLSLKADAIMKIAKAVAVLVAALFVLSLMDSDKLTSGLIRIGWGLGILIGAMMLLQKLDFSIKGAAEINLMIFAMNGLASALILLSIAIAIFGRMDPMQLAQGLGTVAIMITGLVVAAQQMKDHTGDLIGAAFSMTVMAGALIVLSGVITYLGNLDLQVLAKGLIGVGVTIALLSAAMKQMPKKEDATKAGIGMLLLSFAIKKMADAMEQFGGMSWMEIVKGLFTVNLMLEMLVRTIENIPVKDMLQVGVGMLAVAFSLKIIADVMAKFGDMSIEEIGRAMLALAGTMLILSVAVNSMTGAAVGVGALVLTAAALVILAKAMEVLAGMSFAELGMALLGMASALLVLSLAAYAITASGAVVAIFLLGAALVALGAGILLIGGGIYLLASGLEILADVGTKGIAGFGQLIMSLRKYIPEIVAMVKEFVISMAMGILEGMPQIIGMMAKIGDALLDALIKLIPKAVKAISLLIQALVQHMKVMAPEFIELGFIVITNFMKGLDENIEEIVTRAVSIIQKFLGALAENMPAIVTSGTLLLIKFLEGLTSNIAEIVGAVIELITTFIGAIAANVHLVVEAGLNLIKQFLFGIAAGAIEIVATATILIVQFIGALRQGAMLIIAAGVQLIVDVLEGIRAGIVFIADAVGDVITELITQLGKQATRIGWAGIQMLVDLMKGIGDGLDLIMDTAVDVAGQFLDDLYDAVKEMSDKISTFMEKILTLIQNWIDNNSGMIREKGRLIAGAIINGMTGGLAEKAGGFFGKIKDTIFGGEKEAKKAAKIKSPSKVFMEIGRYMGDGLILGMQKSGPQVQLAAGNMSETIISAMNGAMDLLGNIDEFNPTITPVLDLSRVQADAGGISKLMDSSSLSPKVSAGTARVISANLAAQNGRAQEPATPVTHEGPLLQQIINAPTALTTSEIYKQSKNLITLKKEELKIP